MYFYASVSRASQHVVNETAVNQSIFIVFFCSSLQIIEEEVDSDEDDESTAESVNVGPSIKAAAISQMEAATDSLSRELAKLRTGRASAGT